MRWSDPLTKCASCDLGHVPHNAPSAFVISSCAIVLMRTYVTSRILGGKISHHSLVFARSEGGQTTNDRIGGGHDNYLTELP